MPSSHRFSDPAEENNILNHVISEDLQKYGFMYLSLYIPYPILPIFPLNTLIMVSYILLPTSSRLIPSYLHFHLICPLYFYTNSSPEFVGRIPRIVPLHPLTESDLVRIIQDPEDSLLSQVLPPLPYHPLAYFRGNGSINDYSA
jgi:hypothetical protein